MNKSNDSPPSLDPTRCAWATHHPLLMDYHDHEWGVPIYDEQRLFEFLILEGMQAGLNWLTILKKREHYRACFEHFNAEKIALYSPNKMDELMQDAGIIRNRLKIQSIITNARAFLTLKEHVGDLSQYLWKFVDGEPLKNHWAHHGQIPAQTPLSDAMAKDLKKRGFKFVGSTICYAFMQATGMVNDHTVDCFCHSKRRTTHSSFKR
jgi:DNA-3-methyladenine glycosylase I